MTMPVLEGKMKYYISVRSVEGDKFANQQRLGGTRYLAVPEGQIPTLDHQIDKAQWSKTILESFTIVGEHPVGDILFVVHGLNNSIEEIDARHKLIQAGLAENNFPCEVISFDWPAGTFSVANLLDRDHPKTTAFRLVKGAIGLFVNKRNLRCGVRVHVLGHSGGVLVLREAFSHADDSQFAATAWTVGQLVLIAGDVSANSLSANDPRSEGAFRHSYRITNYSNGYDEVLQISNANRLGLEPRVGRVGLPADGAGKAVNVDCSPHFRSSYGEGDGTSEFMERSHAWHFADATFQKDLAITLRGGIDRQLIPTRSLSNGAKQILSDE
jgi:esterase/lipase superfamily enzyme